MTIKIVYITRHTMHLNTQWMEKNFIAELEKHDVQITLFKMFDDCSNINELDACLSSSQMLISDLLDDYLTSELVQRLDSFRNPKLLIAYDNLSIPFKHKKSSTLYDLVWVTSEETRSILDLYGAKTIFMPYAANPYIRVPNRGARIKGVTFVGSLYGARRSILKFIADIGIQVNIYSDQIRLKESVPLWSALRNSEIFNVHEYLRFSVGRKCLLSALLKSMKREPVSLIQSDKVRYSKSLGYYDIPQVYTDSDFCINITELWNTYLLKNPVHKLHLRTFEIPMFGGLQVCKRFPEISQYFEEGKEILLYDDYEELAYLLNKFSHRGSAKKIESIKLNASNRARAEHTWKNRFDRIFTRLGI